MGALGAVLGSLVRFGRNFSRSLGEDGRKMIEVASGAVLGAFFKDFRRWVGKRKTLKNHWFSEAFGTFGRLGRSV